MTDYDPLLIPLIRWQQIQGGRMGTRQTLQVMANLARQGARERVLRSEIQIKFALMGLEQIDTVIRAAFRYRSEFEEVVRTPLFMWEHWKTRGWFEGDCDDVATMYATILLAMGLPNIRFVAIRYSSPEFQHVYVECCDGLTFDPTVERGTNYGTIERMEEPV